MSHKVITSLGDLHDYSLEQSKPEILLELCNSKDERGKYIYETDDLLKIYISLKEILYAHNEELGKEIFSKFSSKSKEDITNAAAAALSKMTVGEIKAQATELLQRYSQDDYFIEYSDSDINEMFQWFINRKFIEDHEVEAPFPEKLKKYTENV